MKPILIYLHMHLLRSKEKAPRRGLGKLYGPMWVSTMLEGTVDGGSLPELNAYAYQVTLPKFEGMTWENTEVHIQNHVKACTDYSRGDLRMI